VHLVGKCTATLDTTRLAVYNSSSSTDVKNAMEKYHPQLLLEKKLLSMDYNHGNTKWLKSVVDYADSCNNDRAKAKVCC
jgi:hypothetical protein